MRVIFHRLITRDMRSALAYYEEQGGTKLADRFFVAIEETVSAVIQHPTKFHFVASDLRRAALSFFPYHFLYEERPARVTFVVLRHDRRHPSFGLGRR